MNPGLITATGTVYRALSPCQGWCEALHTHCTVSCSRPRCLCCLRLTDEGTPSERLADLPKLTRLAKGAQHCLPKSDFEDTVGVIRSDYINSLICRKIGSPPLFQGKSSAVLV